MVKIIMENSYKRFDNPMYLKDLSNAAKYISVNRSHSILITGATGLIGSFLVDMFTIYNDRNQNKIQITAASRKIENLEKRFGNNSECLKFVVRDSSEPIPEDESYDYIIHLASNADPRSYALYPAETITTNINGTLNVLNYAKEHRGTRILFSSTFEVYGTMSQSGKITEEDIGAINFNDVRAGYPESKRTAELLVRSYINEYNVDAVIVRLCSIYGPTMTKNDNKAAAQFIRKAVSKENIVLKSKGEQRRLLKKSG